MMAMYILLVLLILYALFIIICKVKFRFWSMQPVFHFYNLGYWCFPPGIIQHEIPKSGGKFYDPYIEFAKFKVQTSEKKDIFYRLNKQHYLTDKDTHYLPSSEGILSYFQGHSRPCFLSLLQDYQPLINYKTKQVTPYYKCIGSMTTRPLQVSLFGKKLDVYYVDYLCVAKQKRKQGIAQKLIYTHYVKSRQEHSISAYLFKREGVATFIVPMTCYYTYGFYTHNFNIQKDPAPPLVVTPLTFHLFYNFMQEVSVNISCYVHADFSNIKYLLEKKQLYIYLLQDHGEVWGCYIFRNPYTKYKDNGMSVDLVASYCSDSKHSSLFIKKFFSCLSLIPYDYKYLLVEDLGHNIYISQFLKKKYTPFLKSTTSYYFYNFAYRPFLSKDVFVLT